MHNTDINILVLEYYLSILVVVVVVHLLSITWYSPGMFRITLPIITAGVLIYKERCRSPRMPSQQVPRLRLVRRRTPGWLTRSAGA